LATNPHLEVWLLKLVLPGRYGRWLTSASIFVLLYGSYSLLGVFDTPQPSGAPLFFCVVLAYIIPIYHYITERSRDELTSLQAVLTLDAAATAAVAHRISHKRRSWHVWVACIGLLFGIAHYLVVSGSQGFLPTSFFDGARNAALFLGSQAVWLVMTFAVAGLLDNAIVFARLAKQADIDLLNTARLTPFARVAVFSTLAVIGAQASFPLMLIEGDAGAWAFVPGLVATGGPMILLFALPVWPIHRALTGAKRIRLVELNHAISQTPEPDLAQPDTLERLNALLAFRREIQQVSEWPFDVSVVTRLGLYLIIPPLTWVGAALIENLVETLI
jgi:hypothetical protein